MSTDEALKALNEALENGDDIGDIDERIAALDNALENGGDLWQFGTATLKGFADKNFDEKEMREFEDLLDPDDPLLQSGGLGAGPLPSRLVAVDDALANGEDLTHFGTRTLKAALAERSHVDSEDMLDPVEAFDREIARVMREPTSSIPATSHAVQPFGNDTLRGFAAGAPPVGFPTRSTGRAAEPTPPAAATLSAAPTSVCGTVRTTSRHEGPAQSNGYSPRAQLPSQPAKPPEWKISTEMMNQKWGSVLRTLQPSAMNTGVSGRGHGQSMSIGKDSFRAGGALSARQAAMM